MQPHIPTSHMRGKKDLCSYAGVIYISERPTVGLYLCLDMLNTFLVLPLFFFRRNVDPPTLEILGGVGGGNISYELRHK